MSTPLTEEEKERVRFALGYPGTTFGGEQAAAGIAFGISIPLQTAFLLEEAIQVLLTNPYAVDRARRILKTLDDIEQRLAAAGCVLVAEKVGEITLRGAKAGETYPDLLEREYRRWAQRLADHLGVPLYPFSEKLRPGAGTVRNVGVS
jgi:hypothetical protein